MATEAHKFEVGIFVIVATVIALGAAIWLGASRFFEHTERFVTYFAESVQGLDPGAAVKYRGVPAGRVAAIRVAPDGELVEVLMDVDVGIAKVLTHDPTLRAMLELSGITGLRYIEIDQRQGDALNQSPPLHFKPPAELMPSARSSFTAIQNALADVYDQFMKLDLGGISNDVRGTLQTATQLMHDPRLGAIITNLDRSAASTSALLQTLRTTSEKLQPAVGHAAHATAQADTLFTNLNRGVKGEELGNTLAQLSRLTQSTEQFVLGLQSTLNRLDRTVANLQGLTEEVRTQPSLLLFSAPPLAAHPAGAPAQ